MRHRRLGDTGLLVSELCLGTNTFGGGGSEIWRTFGALEQPQVDAVVGCALEGGINFLDTADVYAAGESELRVGQAMRNLRLDRADIVIATKAGGRTGQGINRAGASRAHLTRAVEDSLRRLQTDYVDLFMVHYFDPATPLHETLRALDDLVSSGKVRYIGCSNFTAWQIMKANGIAAREGLTRFEAVEVNWSVATRGVEREIAPMAADQKIGVMVWGALVGGLLSGKYRRDGAGAGQGRAGGEPPPVIDREMLFDVVEALTRIGAEKKASAAQVALAWLLHKPVVTSVLFGARTPEQVTENLGAADILLSDEEIEALDELGALTPDYGPWLVRGSSNARLPYA